MAEASQSDQTCPKCHNPLSEVTTTTTGRKIQRCSAGSWDPQARKTIGCDYVKWLPMEAAALDEKCPKCGNPLLLTFTRFGKKMKKCSTSGWDKDKKQPTGCDYIEWISGSSEKLDEDCPKCGEKLVLYTTAADKKMKKCSTNGWDKEKKAATGCDYIEWLRVSDYKSRDSEEFLPTEPGQ